MNVAPKDSAGHVRVIYLLIGLLTTLGGWLGDKVYDEVQAAKTSITRIEAVREAEKEDLKAIRETVIQVQQALIAEGIIKPAGQGGGRRR